MGGNISPVSIINVHMDGLGHGLAPETGIQSRWCLPFPEACFIH